VIKQHVCALKDDCDFLILTGSETEAPFPVETASIPGLGYSKNNEPNSNPEVIAKNIINAIHAKWPEGCDVIHVHNPLLAKNRHFLTILNILKQRHHLFLQVHDFAEDGRPFAFFKEEYPSDCHYGVINSRDYVYLLSSGLKKHGLHIIPNNVSLSTDMTPPDKINPRILYPVRAIRRKNIGEAILLSLFTGEREIAITQPPNSIHDFIPYNSWKTFTDQNKLRITFEAGLKSDFSSLVNTSESLISTSISEGFGFTFLEPWLAGKFIWGRNITDICSDFEANQITLDHLYHHILIPLDLFDNKKFYNIWSSCILRNCRRFYFMIDQSEIDQAFEKLTQNNTIDFGLLDESFQKEVISNLLSDQTSLKRLIDINPSLEDPGNTFGKEEVIEKKQRCCPEKLYERQHKKETSTDIW